MEILGFPAAYAQLPGVREWAKSQPGLRLEHATSLGQVASRLLAGHLDGVICELGPDPEAAIDLVRETRARGDQTPFVLIAEREVEETVSGRLRVLGQACCLARSTLSARHLGSMLGHAAGSSRTGAAGTQSPRAGDLAPAMIWRTDASGEFRHFSRRWCLFTGRSEEKERGSGWLDGIHADDRDRWHELYASALAEQREFSIDIRMRSARGDFCWVRHRGIPCSDDRGEFSGYLGSSFDVTDLKQSQLDSLGKLKELTQRNRDLQGFLHSACHDLNEPLRTLKLQLREMSPGGESDPELTEQAIGNVDRMQTLLRDLLECTRISTRGAPIEPTALETPLAWALANLRGSIEEIEAQITHDPLPIVPADATQMAQVFQNLLGNALHFRLESPVRVHIGMDRRNDGWVFHVRDNGMGIDPAHHESVFELFRRVGGPDSRSRGVGLAICKQIVERHGGRIWVESKLGAGSTFFFSLPG